MSMSYETIAAEKAALITQTGRATILAIETSCDETAAAVVRNGREVLSSAVYSQIPIHEQYGGVVPELASRNHTLKLRQVVTYALEQAKLPWDALDAIAVTSHPGLVGALLTGVNYAKGLAYALSLPLVGVDHIAGHIAANYICHPRLHPPFVALVASGSHSHLFHVLDYNRYALLGRTRDDAAGEAFDKIARILELGYPGGPKLEQLAKQGDPAAIVLPIGMHGDAGLDFSFSGLKTAAINALHMAKQRGTQLNYADLAASFQYSIVESLTQNALRAALQYAPGGSFVLAGGVAANQTLRERLREAMREAGLVFYAPEGKYTGDNAAMIGCAGHYALCAGERSTLALNAVARNAY